jgi:hypothetical protein
MFAENYLGMKKEPDRCTPRMPSVQKTTTWLRWSDNSLHGLHGLPNPPFHLLRCADSPHRFTSVRNLQSPDNSRLPLPDQSPTPESPVHAPPSKNNRPVLPASPSETADMVHSRKRKRQAAASSEHTPTPGSPVQSHNRKDVIQPLENIFNDDSPLTDEEEVTQPAKRTRKGGRAQPQRAARKPRK